jgi:hypothetical protein
MSANRNLYRRIADVVRAHSGSDSLTDELFSWFLDEVEGLAAARFDELHDPAPDAYDSGRRGYAEHEAAQRWCPFVREVTPVGKSKKDAAIGNRYLADKDYANPTGCRCIASHCMAWRWVTELHGHCGLAGSVGLMPRNEPRSLPNRIPPARIDPVPPQLELFNDDGAVDRRHGSTDQPIQAAAKEPQMSTKDAVFPSKYLKAADLGGRSLVLEIQSAPQETLTGADGRQDQKTVLYFTRTNKKLPLNRINWDAVVDVTGEVDSDNWPGHKVELYPSTTELKGQTVPCVRIRTPNVRVRTPAMAKPEAAPPSDMDDEITF